jgi:hypothetical protein
MKAEASGKAAADPPRTAKAARTSAKPGGAAAGKAGPRGRATSSGPSSRGRTAAVKGVGSGDGVDLFHDMDEKGRHGSASLPETSGQAVGAVVRGAAGIAVTGARVAGAVTQELLRRLPRP